MAGGGGTESPDRLLPAKGRRREDYLKTIYLLSKEKKEIRVRDIAEALGVRPASVVEYLEKLAADKLIEYHKGEGVVELTDRGLAEARKVAEKYEALYDFLVQVLGIPPERARREACYAEHGLSQDTVQRFKELAKAIAECRKYCPSLIPPPGGLEIRGKKPRDK